MRIDFYFNRVDHKLTKLFFLIAQPDDEEKIPNVVFKIIDSFLSKNIPKITDFFIFTSLKKVLQRTDWLLPATEQIQMWKIDHLKRQFIKKFPIVAKEVDLFMLANSIGKVDLTYYINNENILTGDPRENFDSRKTKIKDENYQSLYDQLVQEWMDSEQLEQFDGAIIESPKNAHRRLRKSRLHFIQNEEDIEDEDLDELNNVNESQELAKVHSDEKGVQTYKFEQLAELVVEKNPELEFDDELDSNSSYASEDGEKTG